MGDSPDDGAEGPAIEAPEPGVTEIERPGDGDPGDALIVEGSRNSSVFHHACDLVRAGVSKAGLLEEIRTFNTNRCRPPLSDSEIEHTVDSAWRCASPETAPMNAAANVVASGITPSDRPYLDACTVGQLWDQKFPTPRWAIKGIMPEGLGILAGPPKTGKSWFGTQAASSVALGRCTFGDFNVERGKALYCGLEDGPRRFQSRTKKQFADGDIPSSTLYLVGQGQLKTLNQGGLDQLRGFLDMHPTCKFVVIDTYGRFRGGRRSINNDRYQEDVGIGDKLQRLAHEYGISLLFVHHTRKMGAEDWVDTISGSTGIAGSADFILVLQRVRGGADATLHVTGRDILEQSFAMNFDAQTCLWKITGNAAEVAMSDQRVELRDYLVQLGAPETPTKIAAALGFPVTNVKNLLWKMREDGQIKSTGRGKYFVEAAEEDSKAYLKDRGIEN
jgi:hypothetical protein